MIILFIYFQIKVSLELSDINENIELTAASKKRKISSVAENNGPGTSGGSSRDKFPSSAQISAKPISNLHPLRSRDFVGQHGLNKGVNVVEFSDDSYFFISGGDDGRVLLWPTSKAADEKWTPEPIAMDTVATPDKEGNNAIFCLAMSSENQSIFSGSDDTQLLIHDVNS